MKKIVNVNRSKQRQAFINVCAYCRVSTQKERQINSLASQVSYYSNIIHNTPGWRYIGVYYDEGISGRSTKRPGFNEMMAKARSKQIDIILCKSISRFSRNIVDCLKTIRELNDLGIEIRFEKEGINTSDKKGELLLSVMAYFAESESNSLGENVIWGINRRFQEGIGHHDQMFGYDIIDGQLIINEDEARIIRFIFDEYLKGIQISFICKKLNERGFKAANGGQFTNAVLTKILKQERYTGVNTLQKSFSRGKRGDHKENKGEFPKYIVEDYQPAIISKEDFAKVQKIKPKRTASRSYKKKVAVNSPLAYKLVCDKCGFFFGRHSSQGKYYWRCDGREYHKCCNARSFSEISLMSQLDGFSLKEIEKIIIEDGKVKEVIECQKTLL